MFCYMLDVAAYNAYVMYGTNKYTFRKNNRHRRICLEKLTINLIMPLIENRACVIVDANMKHYNSSVVNAIISFGIAIKRKLNPKKSDEVITKRCELCSQVSSGTKYKTKCSDCNRFVCPKHSFQNLLVICNNCEGSV